MELALVGRRQRHTRRIDSNGVTHRPRYQGLDTRDGRDMVVGRRMGETRERYSGFYDVLAK
jgi:hypothetical protein